MPRNETSRTSGKRPMRALNPQEKIDAINRVHNGESKAAVARDIGVPESTLRGWCKAEDKIRTQLNNMRASGNYEHILTTSSSDNSDNSRPDSSSRSTPTAQNTMALSTSGTEKAGEEPEAGPVPKRIKFDNNLTSAAGTVNFNNISTSTRVPAIDDPILSQTYLYNMLGGGDAAKGIALFNSLLLSGFSSNVYGNNVSLLNRNNGAMTMTNIMPTNNVPINGNKRKYSAAGLSSTPDMTRLSSRRQHSQSPNMEKPSGSISQPVNSRISPMPSTSATNGDLVASTSTKSTKDCKKLNAIICQLQQQQGVSSIRGCNADEEMLSTNATNNNNNNVDHINNETRRRSPNSLPPGFSEALSCCAKLVQWLENYGSAVFTFQQVTQVRTILENLTNWANIKESEPKKKSNGTS